MPIYDKPTKTLMAEYAATHLKPGQVFNKQEPIDWFRSNYPNIKSNTVGLHVEGMAANNAPRTGSIIRISSREKASIFSSSSGQIVSGYGNRIKTLRQLTGKKS